MRAPTSPCTDITLVRALSRFSSVLATISPSAALLSGLSSTLRMAWLKRDSVVSKPCLSVVRTWKASPGWAVWPLLAVVRSEERRVGKGGRCGGWGGRGEERREGEGEC